MIMTPQQCFKSKKPQLEDWDISYVVKANLVILNSKHLSCVAYVHVIINILNEKASELCVFEGIWKNRIILQVWMCVLENDCWFMDSIGL